MNRSLFQVYDGCIYICHFHDYELAMRVAKTIYDYKLAFSPGAICIRVEEFRNGKTYPVYEWSANNGD